MTNINQLITELKKFDNKKGYKLEYDLVKKELGIVVEEIKQKGELALQELHKLIEHAGTWSCLFALEILKEIKSESSIPFLIKFIIKNEEGDCFDICENAMFALQAIGKPAIQPLLVQIKAMLDRKQYLCYLIGALTEIKDEEVYNFMKEITQDYYDNVDKYFGWFMIHDFTYHFTDQGNKEITPLLKQISSMKHLRENEIIELESTIEATEDPEAYKQKIKREFELLNNINVKLGRNETCWCGSGIKYKKCCLDNDLKELGKPRKV